MNIFKNRPLAFSLLVFLSTQFILSELSPVIKAVMLAVSSVGFVISILLRKRFDLITGAFGALIFAVIFGYAAFNIFNTAYPCDNTVRNAEYEIYDISYRSDDIAYFKAKVKSLDKRKTDFKVSFTYYGDSYAIEEGDVISSELKFVEFEEKDPSFDERRYYASIGIFNSAVVESDFRFEIKENVKHPFNGFLEAVREKAGSVLKKYTSKESLPLLLSLSTGDKSTLDASLKRDFSRLGISHMLAISGMHLSILINCIFVFTELMKAPKRKAALISVLVTVFYILLTGASASVLRAGIMLVIMNSSLFFRRQGDSLTSLTLAVFLIILFSPSSVYDIGLILSFTSTLGIIIILPSLMKLTEKASERIGRVLCWMLSGICVTLGALTFSLVPMIVYFEEFSLAAVLTNLLFGHLVTVILTLIPILICISWFELFALGTGFVLDILARAVIELSRYISGFEGLTISCAYPFVFYGLILYLIGVAIAFVLKKRGALIICYCSWFAFICICLIVYNAGFGEDARFIYSSYKNNDAVIMRHKDDCVYFDFGNISKSGARAAFSLVNSEALASETDAWVIGAYSDNCLASVRDYINEKYIASVYLPTPGSKEEKIIAEEMLYYADKAQTDIVFFEYGKSFSVCGASVYISKPLSESRNNVYSAYIDFNSRSCAYYSRGYFEYSDDGFDANTVFLGSNGVSKDLYVSPRIECDTLIIESANKVISDQIKADKRIELSDKRSFVNYN